MAIRTKASIRTTGSNGFHGRQGKCVARGFIPRVDYFLWALQRAYERGEPRYIEYVWQRVSLVHDIDDTREKPYGEYYSKIRPMDIEAIKRGSGI